MTWTADDIAACEAVAAQADALASAAMSAALLGPARDARDIARTARRAAASRAHAIASGA